MSSRVEVGLEQEVAARQVFPEDSLRPEEVERDLEARPGQRGDRLQLVQPRGRLGEPLEGVVGVDQVLGRGVTARLEEPVQLQVFLAEHQGAPRGVAVAAGPAELLVEGLDGAREVGVDHEADVGLVDPQAERVRRHHDRDLAAHEPVLVGGAIGRPHAAMVTGDAEALGGQAGLELVQRLDRRDVDDAAPLGLPAARRSRPGSAAPRRQSRPRPGGGWGGRTRCARPRRRGCGAAS